MIEDRFIYIKKRELYRAHRYGYASQDKDQKKEKEDNKYLSPYKFFVFFSQLNRLRQFYSPV